MKESLIIRPTDSELEEFLFLQKLEKQTVKRLTELKDLCKQRGSFCQADYVCTVYEQEQTRLVGLKEAADAIGMQTLIQNDMVKVVSFCIVKVTRAKSPVTND